MISEYIDTIKRIFYSFENFHKNPSRNTIPLTKNPIATHNYTRNSKRTCERYFTQACVHYHDEKKVISCQPPFKSAEQFPSPPLLKSIRHKKLVHDFRIRIE